MADSLDDFFAKKDKKRRNKNQSAALSAEALVRELEEGAKKNEYSARREGKTSGALGILGLDADDNDWKDFEEIEKRDYTGLKLKEMSIQDQEEEQRRLIDQIEPVPETIPWRSKEDTVAALISTRNDTNPIDNNLTEQQEPPTDTETDPAASALPAPTPEETTDTAPTKTDNDASEEAPSSTQPHDEEATTAKTEPKQGDTEKATEDDDATKKEGDSKPAVSVKKTYVPPHERLEKECKVLEPIRLGKLKSSSSRPGTKINIGDEKAFPSLG